MIKRKNTQNLRIAVDRKIKPVTKLIISNQFNNLKKHHHHYSIQKYVTFLFQHIIFLI